MWSLYMFSSLVTGLLLVRHVGAASTCHTASNRACWSEGFDINTDWEAKTPPGTTRSYTLTITERDNWLGPDGGIKKKAMLINGAFPGPVITADWGDTILVKVVNSMTTNGTSIHWHGLRQLNNAIHDGTNGVTECPIPPGSSKTYSYHSHFGSQYGNGVTGSILIRGPASLPYDVDLGVFPITDWYYGAADQIQLRVNDPNNPFIAGAAGSPPPSDNILFNGSNISPSGGDYSRVTLTPQKRHLLRLINPSVENTFSVSLVGHHMTVIATDFVPVNAFTTDSLFLGIGQRYDVAIDADAAIGNYWFNVTMSSVLCGTTNAITPAAIFSYAGASNALPNTTGTVPTDPNCMDQLGWQPVVTREASLANFSPSSHDLPVTFEVNSTDSIVHWKVNGSGIRVDWSQPTLQYVLEGNTSYPREANIITLPSANVWSIWLIENLSDVPHPMHLHGHDFLILGRGTGTFTSSDTSGLQTGNPPRRDSTILGGNGWLVVAFETDNPGAWLFHCHIAWHVSQGLSVQYLERASNISTAMDLDAITPTCQAWRSWYPTAPFPQYDSGL